MAAGDPGGRLLEDRISGREQGSDGLRRQSSAGHLVQGDERGPPGMGRRGAQPGGGAVGVGNLDQCIDQGVLQDPAVVRPGPGQQPGDGAAVADASQRLGGHPPNGGGALL